MPWPVYSERFIAHTVGGAWTRYVVPSDKRAIVTHIAAVNFVTELVEVRVQVHGLDIWYRRLPAYPAADFATTRMVAYEAEHIAVYTSPGVVMVTVCGYLFEDRYEGPHPSEELERVPVGWDDRAPLPAPLPSEGPAA